MVALAFPGDTDAALASEVDEIAWHPLGQLEAQIAFLHAHGVRDALMIGKVPKLHLVRDFARLAPDARALALLRDLRTRSDDGILGAIADELGREKIVLRRQTELLRDWVASEGVSARWRRTTRNAQTSRSPGRWRARSVLSTSGKPSSCVTGR